MTLAPPHCQLHDRLAAPSLRRRLQQWIADLRARFRLRTRLRQWRAGGAAPSPPRLGKPSRFAAGSWVRVRDADRIYATLDEKKQLRGLLWVWQQWAYCGTVHRVFKPVRRMMDDSRQMRPISTTVLLDTAPCGGPLGRDGCGRECPLMFRDDWLEEVPAPPDFAPAPRGDATHATVRPLDEILRTLDADGRHGGLTFMREMQAHAGKRFRVYRKIEHVLDGGKRVPVAQPLYLLADLHCTGAAMGADGPCERACRLIWHADWLRLDSASPPLAGLNGT